MNLHRIAFLVSFTVVAIGSVVRAQGFPEAIEDNSFLVEEAYNQEVRVVQHISNGIYSMTPDHDFTYTFTQEWPASGETHQLSYSLSFLALGSNQVHGLGDVLINYRYQLATKDNWAAIAPRLSVIIPTGNKDQGLGSGVFGFQTLIPLSKRLTDRFIVHANAGATMLPSVGGTTSSGSEVKRTLISFLLGGSGIWLAGRYDNFFVECIYTNSGFINGSGNIERESATILNPAYRHALEFGSLEIVPGIGFPITISLTSTDLGLFFYLSFEHPY